MLGGFHIFEKTNNIDFCKNLKKINLVFRIINFQNLIPWLVFK